MKVNPNKTWALMDARIKSETDPVLRRNIEIVRKHAYAEATLDMEVLMSTVSEKASYHSFSSADENLSPTGKDGVFKFYTDFAASGAARLEHDITRLLVDKDAVLTEGMMRMAFPGRTLMTMGIAVDDPEASYMYETHMAIIWQFDEHGLISCEDSYTGVDGFAGIASRKLKEEDILSPEPA
jgi:hypothetical protein